MSDDWVAKCRKAAGLAGSDAQVVLNTGAVCLLRSTFGSSLIVYTTIPIEGWRRSSMVEWSCYKNFYQDDQQAVAAYMSLVAKENRAVRGPADGIGDRGGTDDERIV